MKFDRKQEIKRSGQSHNSDMSVKTGLSVLLPTYNRAETLQRTLQALERQLLNKSVFEIIVVDDGSSDHTVDVLNRFAENTDNRFTYAVLKKNGGPSRARNIGLSMVRGDIVLIIGDDIEPDESLLEKHYQFHSRRSDEKYAMLGYVSFPKEFSSSFFMRWLEKDGREFFFNYAKLKPEQEAGPLFFYTCNVSLKMSLLTKSGWFDESFPYASHEDLELGCRLSEKGMRLVYDPTAAGFHWHVLTIDGVARRIYLMGHSAGIFWQKGGDEGSLPKRYTRRILTEICSLPPLIYIWNYLRKKTYSEKKRYPIQWKILLFLGFFIGLSDMQKNQKLRV